MLSDETMMKTKETFISERYRPEVRGSFIDIDHDTYIPLPYDASPMLAPLDVNAICFGPRKDNVLIHLEHLVCEDDGVLFLYYEDLFKRWSYFCCSGELSIVYQYDSQRTVMLRAKFAYIRGCMVTPESKHWLLLGDFYNAMSLWQGRFLCNPLAQLSNESKLFQLRNSLLSASKKASFASEDASIRIGKSYVIKGLRNLNRLESAKAYVVKSLSGVRSIAVDASDYATWNLDALNHGPVLFQEKVSGVDVRVHALNGALYVKQSSTKAAVDYRYDPHFYTLSDMKDFNDTFAQFCMDVCWLEHNNLMGIDFIKSKDTYTVLEANPCPGWSAYHPYNGIDQDDFLEHLLDSLKGMSQDD